jgi:hypothetical protein
MMEESNKHLMPPSAYVNFLRVAHQQSEFFLAFGQVTQQQGAQAHLVSSLVASPEHAKSMLAVLAKAVERYEKRFGEIPTAAPASDSAPPESAERGRPGSYAMKKAPRRSSRPR